MNGRVTTTLMQLLWGWRMRWPNVLHVSLIWYGAIWLIVESLGALDKDRYAFLQTPATLWLAVGASLAAGLATNRYRTFVSFELPRSNTSIVLKIGDLFTEQGLRLIPVNEFFDSKLGTHVSPRSLHGQLIEQEFAGNSSHFDRTVAAALNGVPHEFVARTTGNCHRYEVGTVATLERSARRYLLFVLARTNLATLEAYAELEDLVSSLQRTWTRVRSEHNGERVVVPLVGTGLSRIGLPLQQMLDLLLLTFLAENKKKEVCTQLVVVLYPGNFKEYDLLAASQAWRK